MAGLNASESYLTGEKREAGVERPRIRRLESAPAAVNLNDRRKVAAASLRRMSEEVHRQKFPHLIDEVRQEHGLDIETSVSLPNDAMFNRAWRYACNLVSGWNGA